MLTMFINKFRKFILLTLAIIDIVVTICTLVVACLIINNYTNERVLFNGEFFIVTTIVLTTWVVLLKVTNLSKIPRTSPVMVLANDFFKLSIFGSLILLLSDWIIKFDNFPAIALALFIALNFVSLFTIRVLTFKVFKIFRANGHNIKNIVIIATKGSEHIIDKIITQKEWGFRILYIVSDSERIKQRFGQQIKIHPRNANIKSLLRYDIIDELLCFSCLDKEKRIVDLMDYCAGLGITFRLHGKRKALANYTPHIQYFDKEVFTTFENNPINKFHHAIKSSVEIMLSLFILISISPILLAISLLIALSSKGPVIFKQERVGLRGRKFYIYKFRTMLVNAEELKEKLMKLNECDGPAFKIKEDPRITKIGKFLRKSCIDELPQLFNVLKGEMALIGPRPPIPTEVDQYEEWQLKRLAVKPGLTCTWQIVPNRNDVKFNTWVEMDINYIDNWTLKTDVELFFKTFKTVLFARGA